VGTNLNQDGRPWLAHGGKNRQGAAGPAQRILIVDDDVELCELVAEYLLSDGFQVTAVNNGIQGAKAAVSGEFVMVVLDLMLPGIQGYEVLRRVRSKSSIPVIMLSARGEDSDRILGLETGADDYLPKPFNPRELSARIHAVLRRASVRAAEVTQAVPGRVVYGDVTLDPGARIVCCGNREVDCTGVEFDLLAVFLKTPGRVIPREELARTVLGRELGPFDRSIDVHVSNLRRKLGLLFDGGERIKSIRSSGYLYVAAELKSR
jgi:DNA-binding response OmpR family regulator